MSSEQEQEREQEQQEADERTRQEEQMVLTAPLGFELEAVGQEMVKLIKQVPPEGQPAALAAAIAVIEGFRLAADAAVAALPDFPPSLSTPAIEAQAQMLETVYKNLPPQAPPATLVPGVELVSSVEAMVAPLGGDPPTYPHYLTREFVNHQLDLLAAYDTEKTFQ